MIKERILLGRKPSILFISIFCPKFIIFINAWSFFYINFHKNKEILKEIHFHKLANIFPSNTAPFSKSYPWPKINYYHYLLNCKILIIRTDQVKLDDFIQNLLIVHNAFDPDLVGFDFGFWEELFYFLPSGDGNISAIQNCDLK